MTDPPLRSSSLRSLWRKLTGHQDPNPDAFLASSKGVIHVGANVGQEREIYARHDLDVLWIEPIPTIFEKLNANIAPFLKQKASCALITDTDGRNYPFHISNNEGQSSSMLDFAGHKALWPGVDFTETITLTSSTLPSLLRREEIDPSRYDTLVLDTQGSELLILKSATDILPQMRFIKAEAADFESYVGCCTLKDLDAFLGTHGFKRTATIRFAHKEGVGAYFDVLYKRSGA